LFQPNFGAPLPGPLAVPQRFGTRANEVGIFLVNYIDIGERWHALLGVRRAKFDRTNTVSGAREADSAATTPNFGLVYNVSPSLSLYASAGRSFEPNGGQAVDGSFFDPRRGTNIEVGLKGDAFDRRIHYTAALFELVEDNRTTADLNNPNFSVLTGEITVQGAELEVTAAVTPRLSLIGALTLLDARVTRSNDGLVGNRPSNAPRITGGVRLAYRADGGWRFGGTLSHVGQRKVSEWEQVNVPGYTRLDLDASLQLAPHWTLSAALENVFDKNYIATARFGTQILTGRPRTLTVSARYEF
jgi:iron complex outermembrane receptor protein